MAAPPLAALIEVRYFHLLEMFTGKIGFPLKVESKLNRLFLMDFKSTQSKDLDSFWLTRCYLHSKAWELLLSHSRCDKTAIHTDETMWKVSQVLQMTNLLMMSVWVYPAKKEEEKTNKQTNNMWSALTSHCAPGTPDVISPAGTSLRMRWK